MLLCIVMVFSIFHNLAGQESLDYSSKAKDLTVVAILDTILAPSYSKLFSTNNPVKISPRIERKIIQCLHNSFEEQTDGLILFKRYSQSHDFLNKTVRTNIIRGYINQPRGGYMSQPSGGFIFIENYFAEPCIISLKLLKKQKYLDDKALELQEIQPSDKKIVTKVESRDDMRVYEEKENSEFSCDYITSPRLRSDSLESVVDVYKPASGGVATLSANTATFKSLRDHNKI